jgi:hypothetical protein
MMNSWKPWHVCCPGSRGSVRQPIRSIRRTIRYGCGRRIQGKTAPCLRIKHLYGSWSPLKESGLDEREN